MTFNQTRITSPPTLVDLTVSHGSVIVSSRHRRSRWALNKVNTPGEPAEEASSRQVGSGQIPIHTLFSPLDAEGAFIRATNVDPFVMDYELDFMLLIYDYWVRWDLIPCWKRSSHVLCGLPNRMGYTTECPRHLD
jgi:hypothetical protein